MQKFYKTIILICFVPILMKAQPKVVDEVITVVGSNIISRSELDFEITQAEAQYGTLAKKDKCEMLENMMVKKLLLNQAKLDSVVVTDSDIEADLDNKIRYFAGQVGSIEKLEEYLGKSILEYKNEIRPKIVEQQLIKKLESKLFGDVKVSHREVKNYFDSIPIDSLPRIDAEYEVGQLVVQPSFTEYAKLYAYKKAQDLRERVVNGESFELLARSYSSDPGSAQNGGLLPDFGRGEMVGEFEAAAFKLKADSISPVFETDYGYHFIQLVSRLGDRISARHILIKPLVTKTEQAKLSLKMDSIHTKLANKSITFCQAVSTFSNVEAYQNNCGFLQDPYTGLSKISLKALDPQTAQVISKMVPGEFSEPALFYMQDGSVAYRIIYLKSETKAHVANLNDDYARVQIAAQEAKKNEEILKWVAKTREKTFVKMNTDYLGCDLSEWINFTE